MRRAKRDGVGGVGVGVLGFSSLASVDCRKKDENIEGCDQGAKKCPMGKEQPRSQGFFLFVTRKGKRKKPWERGWEKKCHPINFR